MASLPPNLDFAKMEEEICETWAKEETFKKQNSLSLERGDDVSAEWILDLSLLSSPLSRYLTTSLSLSLFATFCVYVSPSI